MISYKEIYLVLFSSLCTSTRSGIGLTRNCFNHHLGGVDTLMQPKHGMANLWVSWFLEQVMSGKVDLNDEPRTMVCRFVLQTSATSITNEVTSDLQISLDVLTERAVLEVSKEEVQVCAFVLSCPLQEFVKGL